MNGGRIRWGECLVACVVCALAALLSNIPLFVFNQLFCSEDLNAYFRWSEQFVRSVGEGMWRPRWDGHSWEGLGTKAYGNYLFFYLVTLVHLAVADVWNAMRLSIGLVNFLIGLLVVAGLRRYVTLRWALAAAVAVQFSPFAFHAVSHHNLVPFYATMLPLSGLFLSTLRHDGRRFLRPGVILWLAVLVLTHPLTAFMVLICFPFYFLPVVFRGFRFQVSALLPALSWGVSALLGLGLAAWHLYPILAGMQETVTGDWFEPVYLDWRNSFIVPMVTPYFFGMRWFSVQWVLGGLAVACALYAAMVAWLGRHDAKQGSLWAGMAALLAAACFWAMEWSYPLWAASGHLRYVQFPYRFLQIVLTLSPIVIVLSVGCRVSGVGKSVSGVGCGEERVGWPSSLVSSIIGCDRQQEGASVSGLQSPVLLFAGLALLLCFPLLSALLQYRILEVATEPDWDNIRIHHYARLFEPEQEAGWRRYVAEGYLEGEARRLGMAVETQLDHVHDRVWIFEVPEGDSGVQPQPHRPDADDILVRLPVFYHPGWWVNVDGEVVVPFQDEESALLAIKLPPGRSKVRMYWGVMPEEWVGYWVSGVALVVLVGALGGRGRRCQGLGGRRSEVGWES